MSEESMPSDGGAEVSAGSEGLEITSEINDVVGEDPIAVEASAEEGEPSQELKEEIESATKEEIKEAEKNLKKKYKLKVDGEEFEEELSEEDIIRELQLAKKARKELQYASNVKKDASDLLEYLRTNPVEALQDELLGHDFGKLAEDYLSKQVEDSQKDPLVREKEALEMQLEELRNKTKQDEEQRQSQEYERLVVEEERKLEEGVSEALESSGLPNSPYIIKKVTDVMLSGMNNGINVSPKQAMNIVKKEVNSELRSMLDASDDDALEQFIGRNNVKRLNKKSLSRVKKTPPTANSLKSSGKVIPKDGAASKGNEDKQSIKDWLRNSR